MKLAVPSTSLNNAVPAARWRQVLFIVLSLLCLSRLISPPVALLAGLIIAQTIGHPFLSRNKKLTGLLLQVSVVGLGFGMNIFTALQAGSKGILFTIVSIAGTLLLGALLGKLLRVESKTSHLISCGTAICGGSAIAAISPIIKAEEKQISVALGTVFILNSIALFLFPFIGHQLGLSQTQFGLWSAIAIHDTSSVVGAAARYGEEALQVATTVKLARALWIIPVAIGTSLLFRNKDTKIKIPWFIGWFIVAMLINTYVPATAVIAPYLVGAAKSGLTLTLFLIGAGLSRKTLKEVGFRSITQGLILWIVISISALWMVCSFA
ncbi:MAG: putative sulfate exporter family transporter [Flaviaesturariibacter sp.]|nr:putative sulfate exporter family transporter [Flaviaesturariibacter sp.]